MTIWDLRETMESAVPWWVPFVPVLIAVFAWAMVVWRERREVSQYLVRRADLEALLKRKAEELSDEEWVKIRKKWGRGRISKKKWLERRTEILSGKMYGPEDKS